jgi:structural maintenance of chromosome 4
MRLNKVSELIHNSTNHQNLDKAAVSVHFQEIIDLVKLQYLLEGMSKAFVY